MSSTPKPSLPSPSSPSENQIHTFRVSVSAFGDETPEAYWTMEEPSFWSHLTETGALPDWLVFQTIAGEKVAIREENVHRVTVLRELAVDFDEEYVEPPVPAKRKSRKVEPSTDSVD